MATNCTKVAIDNITEAIEPVSVSLAAIGGLILGLLLGLLVVFLYKKCFSDHPISKDELLAPNKSDVNSQYTYQNYFEVYGTQDDLPKKKTTKNSSKIHPITNKNAQTKNIVEKDEVLYPVLTKVLIVRLQKNEKASLDTLAQLELNELQNLELEFWSTRVFGSYNIMKMAMKSLVSKEIINNKIAELIVSTQEIMFQDLRQNLTKLKLHLKKSQDDHNFSMDLQSADQSEYLNILKSLASDYFLFWKTFLVQLENQIEGETYPNLYNEFLQQIIKIEQAIGENLEIFSQKIKEIFKHFEIITQSMDINDMAFKFQADYLITRLTSLISRLLKAGRISSNTKDELMAIVKDIFTDTGNDKIHEEILEMIDKLYNDSIELLKKELKMLEKTSSKTLQYHSSESNLRVGEFVANFVQIRFNQLDQRVQVILNQFAKDAAVMDTFVKEKLSPTKSGVLHDKLREFCDELLKFDAVEENESESMKNELWKDSEKSHIDVMKHLQASVQHFWQQLDEKQQENWVYDNSIFVVILNGLVNNNYKNVKFFVDNNPLFPESKTERIFLDRDVVLALLGNLLNLNRIEWAHIFSSDLVKSQWVLMNQQVELLAENKIQQVEKVLERLWKERDGMLNHKREIIMCSSMHEIINFCDDILSQSIAHEIIKEVKPKKLKSILEQEQWNEINGQLQKEIVKFNEDADSKITFHEEKLKIESNRLLEPFENNFKNEVKRISENVMSTKNSVQEKLIEIMQSVALNNPQQFDFDRINAEHLLKMEMNDLETITSLVRHSAVQYLKHSFDPAIKSVLEDTRKAHMCRIAFECGITKSQFRNIVEEGVKNGFGSDGDAKQVASDFIRFWKTSKQKFNKRPV